MEKQKDLGAPAARETLLRQTVQRIVLRLLKDADGVRSAGRYARTEYQEGHADACADIAKLLTNALHDTRPK